MRHPLHYSQINCHLYIKVIFQFEDQEEFLYMLNLKYHNLLHPRASKNSEQGFINELYLWERLDLGLEYNNMIVCQVINNYQILFFSKLSTPWSYWLMHQAWNCYELWIFFPSFIYFRLHVQATLKTPWIKALSFINSPDKKINLKKPASQLWSIWFNVISMKNTAIWYN